MPSRLVAVLLSAASLALIAVSSPTSAQSADAGASTPSPQNQKKAERAQRKAERKAARVRNKKEVGALQKNGYDQTTDNTTYPANLQHAQKKASGAVPASAP